jgi:hypothetical protein
MTNKEAKRNLIYSKRWGVKPDDETLDIAIKALEQTRWIPVSERLPEDGRYLVTIGDAIGRPMVAIRCFNKDLSMVDDYEFTDKKGISGWTEYDSEYGWYIDEQVIAWMPLPESYKAESEGMRV